MSSAWKRLHDIDWEKWSPVDLATLLFVIEGDRILLIRKKRGLGAGKINGPGGRLEPGETPLAAAIREVEEEVGVIPTDIRPGGLLSFQFIDGYSIHVHVFSATGFRGELRETDEAKPLWADLSDIPYPEMWSDDVLWLPLLLDGQGFAGRFVFDGDNMLDHQLDLCEIHSLNFDRRETERHGGSTTA